MADAQSNIQVSIDTTDALASIKNLQRQISAFHSSLAKGGAAANAVASQLQQTLINSVNATGQFSAQIRTIRTTTESFTNSLEKNKFSLGEYFRYAGGASKTFGRLFKTEFDTINKVARENVKDLQTQYIRLGRDASGAMKAIAVRPLSLDMDDLATRTMIASEKQAIMNQLLKQGSTNLLNFGKNTQWAGRQLMVGFTLPLIALGSAASKTFMDMETQAIRFKKVYGDLFTPTGESAQALKDIQELGKEFTKYGIAVSTTVGLAAEAAAAGFKGVDLQRQTAAATKLSILGQVESQKALETTISLQNAFAMSSENLAESIDFLNAVENQTVLSLDDVSTAIPKAAPIVQQLGGDVKDLAFFMTAMKEGGINASEGANALKSGLASIINPTGKAAAMLESFGINVKKIVVDNKGDLKKTVIEFATALNQLDPLNRAQAIEQLFGKFQFSRLSTLFANVTKEGTQAARVLDLAGSSVQELAALSEKELGMTSESAMNKFKGAVENLKVALVPLGEEFLKAATPIAEFITKIIDKFNNLSENTKKIIVTITAVVAGLGPVFLMTFGLLANGIANIIKGFTFLKTLFNKTGQSTATLGTQVEYMTTEQRNAAAVAASLDQVHVKLAQTFTSEASAVNALTRAYQRAIAAQSQFVPVAPPLTRGPIKKFAGGKPATVGGTGNKDSELALLMPGETVIPTAMSEKYGGLINAMIADKIPGYDIGKPKAGNPSLYGGQSLLYSGLGVFGPGNTSGSTLGMDRSFLMEGDAFLRSLTASAVGGGATLDNPTARLTATATREYADAVKSYMPRIVDVLRTTTLEMEQNGENISSIEDITKKARPKLDKIFSEMTAQGGRAASSATAMSRHLFFPTESEMGGQFGETRVPGARKSSSGKIKSTMYRIKKSIFQSRVKTAFRNLYGSNPEGTYAHMNESRMLGPEVPLRGGALALPESERAPLAARVTAKGRSIREEFFGGISKRRTNSEKAAIRQSGAEDKREYVRGAASVDTQDPYMETRDRKSPHAQASKDGRDDARAYATARDKELRRQSGRTRRVATRGQGPAPIGATPLPGMTILPIVPPDPKTPSSETNPTRTQKLAGRMTGMGGGMGLLGVNMGLSMLPDFAGKGMMQGTLAGANLGMMFGGYGMAIGAAVGLATSAFSALNAKQKEHAAITKSTFSASSTLITAFGDKVLDTELKITNLNSASSDLSDSLGLLSPKVQALVDAINKLPEEHTTKIFIETISAEDLELKSLIGSVRSVVSAQVAGGLDPKNAEALVQALLAAAGKSQYFEEVWKSVSKSVIDRQTAILTSLNKLDEALKKSNDGWETFDNVGNKAGKAYSTLNTEQKLLADQMLNIFAITSNGTLAFSEINEVIGALRDSSVESSVAIAALSAAIYNSQNEAAIARLNELNRIIAQAGENAKVTKDEFILMNLVLQVMSKQDLGELSTNLFGSGSRSVRDIDILTNAMSDSEKLQKLVEEYNKDMKKYRESLVDTEDYQDYDDSADKAKTASELYLEVLEKEINGLEAKRDAQKNVNDESQRQIDLQMKMKNLANEAVLAKISGDYIKAASLQQEAQNVQMEFDQETELRKKDAEIARLKARAQEIRDGASITKAEAAKIPKRKKAASGGMIRGAGTGTSDSIPAYLSNGEYVIKADSVKRYGIGTFDALNAQKFKDGGLASKDKKNWFQRYVEKLTKSQKEGAAMLPSFMTSNGKADTLGVGSILRKITGQGESGDTLNSILFPLNFLGMGSARSAVIKPATGAASKSQGIFSKLFNLPQTRKAETLLKEQQRAANAAEEARKTAEALEFLKNNPRPARPGGPGAPPPPPSVMDDVWGDLGSDFWGTEAATGVATKTSRIKDAISGVGRTLARPITTPAKFVSRIGKAVQRSFKYGRNENIRWDGTFNYFGRDMLMREAIDRIVGPIGSKLNPKLTLDAKIAKLDPSAPSIDAYSKLQKLMSPLDGRPGSYNLKYSNIPKNLLENIVKSPARKVAGFATQIKDKAVKNVNDIISGRALVSDNPFIKNLAMAKYHGPKKFKQSAHFAIQAIVDSLPGGFEGLFQLLRGVHRSYIPYTDAPKSPLERVLEARAGQGKFPTNAYGPGNYFATSRTMSDEIFENFGPYAYKTALTPSAVIRVLRSKGFATKDEVAKVAAKYGMPGRTLEGIGSNADDPLLKALMDEGYLGYRHNDAFTNWMMGVMPGMGFKLTKNPKFVDTLDAPKSVIKKAAGGLIKGPGTGTSDSIRATLGYAGGGSIRVSNGEYVVKASSVKDYGVSAMNAVNNGTATIGTNSGGTVYNINMPITSNNANPEGVANEVMRRLKLEVSKNNKSNKVGL